MLSWEEIFQRYTVKHYDRLKKITSPLKINFSISCFFYIAINNEGHLIWIGNRPDCSEYYLDQKHFINDPCMTHPKNWEVGCYLFEKVAPHKQKTFIKETKNLFNLNSGIVLCKKNNKFIEFFGFVGENKKYIEEIYLNHSNLLNSFSIYFKKEMHSVIHQMKKEPISLISLKGKPFYSTISIRPKIDQAKLKAFLNDCGLGPLLKKADLLSKRERQCLKSLLQGKSAKQTATDFKLSFRTIEYYFENIKNKLVCYNKNEVFKFSKDLEDLGLL
jgi:DNA-binding CsgD family transcriptional regulator